MKGTTRTTRYRTVTIVLLSLVVMVGVGAVGIGIAPVAGADNVSADEEENDTVVINADDTGAIDASVASGDGYADVDLWLTVEDAQAPSGSTVTVDVEIDPVEDEEKQIDWFDLKIDYDNSKLVYNDIQGSQVGEIEVTDIGAGYVQFENRYELGDFFIDPQKAPLTMATIEFVVYGDSGEAFVRPDPDETVTGWGASWMPWNEHDLFYEGGYVEILDADDLGIVEGYVTDQSGQPVEGVDVQVANLAGSDQTDADGHYQLFTSEGPAMLHAIDEGYVNVTETAMVEVGETAKQNLTLDEFDRSDADVTITAADYEAGTGETIDVPIYAFDRGWSTAGSSDGIRGFGSQVEYDPDVLQFIDFSAGFHPQTDLDQISDSIVYLEAQSANEYRFDSPPWEDPSPYHAGTLTFLVVGAEGDTSPVNPIYDETAIAYAAPEDGGPYWPGSETLGNPEGTVVVAGEADVGTATIEGEVTDQDDNPVMGASVSLASNDGAGTTETDSEGSYSLEVTGFQDPDHVIEFDGGADYEEVVEKEVTADDGETVTLDATLEQADAAITVDVDIDDSVAQNERITIPVEVDEASAGVPDEAENGALGYNFLFDYDPDVIEFVGAQSIAFEQTESSEDPPIIDDGDPEVSPDYGELRVLSMDPADSAFPPFTAVEVTFDVIGDEGESTELEIVGTTSDGQELSGVSHDTAYGAWPAIWDSGSITIGDEVVEDDRGTVTGTVTNEEGEPIEGATVEADGISDTTNEDGEYEFEVSEGSYEMTASASGYSTASVDIDVVEDETTEQDVELQALGNWIEVDVEDGAGGQGAIVTIPVEVEELSDEWQDEATGVGGYNLMFDYDTDVIEFVGANDAAFEVADAFTDIPSDDAGYGLGELRVESVPDFDLENTPPFTAVEVDFELVGDPGETTEVELIPENSAGEDVSGISHDPNFGAWPATWLPGTIEVTDEDVAFGHLEVSVVDGEGDPIDGAHVSGAGIDAETGSDGVVEEEVQVGSYDVTVEFEGDEETVEVDIEEGETTAVTVEFVQDEEDDSDDDQPPETGLILTGVSQGGVVAFSEATKDEAMEEPVEFPEGAIEFTAAIDEEAGTWESTSTSFETFTAQNLETEIEAPDGLHGKIDPDAGEMTFEGDLSVTLQGQATIEFSFAATTGESGELSGSIDIAPDGGEAEFVENEYVVPEETGIPLVDDSLDLPADEAGTNWLILPFDLDIEEVEVDDGGDAPAGQGTFQGTIRNEAGEPVEGAQVSLENEFQELFTDSDGQFEFSHMPGEYTLQISADGYDDRTFDIEIVAGEALEGSAIIEGGEPVIETDVSATVIDDSTVEVEGTVSNVGGATAEEDVTLAFGEQSATERVTVEAGESVTVTEQFTVEDDPAGTQAEISAAGASATFALGDDGDGAQDDDEDIDVDEASGTTFVATGQGGFIAFNESDKAEAQDALQFPTAADDEDYISITANVDEEAATWESVDTSFPELQVPDTEIWVSVTAPDGLHGEFDPANDVMTLEGDLRAEVIDADGDPFSFTVTLVSGQSGELTGDINLDEDGGTVSLVDNEYVITERTGNPFLDPSVGLHDDGMTDFAGWNWLQLDFDIEIHEGDAEDLDRDTSGAESGGDGDDGESDDEDDDNGTFIGAFGQLIGIVGVIAGVGLAMFALASRFVTSVDPDPGS